MATKLPAASTLTFSDSDSSSQKVVIVCYLIFDDPWDEYPCDDHYRKPLYSIYALDLNSSSSNYDDLPSETSNFNIEGGTSNRNRNSNSIDDLSSTSSNSYYDNKVVELWRSLVCLALVVVWFICKYFLVSTSWSSVYVFLLSRFYPFLFLIIYFPLYDPLKGTDPSYESESAAPLLESVGLAAANYNDDNFMKVNQGNHKLNPIIELDKTYPDGMAFAVWKSELYMFGGQYMPPDSTALPTQEEPKEEMEMKWESDMYIHDISIPDGDNDDWTTLKKKCLRKGPQMKSGKVAPIAAVIPEADTICVFSSVLFYARTDDSQFPNFEVFDPVFEHWFELPEPILNYSERCRFGDTCRVESYSVRNSTLYISTNQYGIYNIDVKQPNSGWSYLDVSLGVERFPFQGVSVFIDSICFTPFFAYDSKAKNGFNNPIPYLYGDGMISDNLTLTSGDAFLSVVGEDKLCVIKIGREQSSDRDHLEYQTGCQCLNVKVVNITKNAAGVSDFISSINIKSFRFAMGNRCEMVNICGCFPISM